jgi:hypothetical protein
MGLNLSLALSRRFWAISTRMRDEFSSNLNGPHSIQILTNARSPDCAIRRGRDGYRCDNSRLLSGGTGNRNFTMRGECLCALCRNDASMRRIGPPSTPP